MARFTLHGIWLSGPTYKVGLALSLMREPFDYINVNLREGEHKQPAFLEKNRFGQVPCLLDTKSGRHYCQSAAILDFLAGETGKFGGANDHERLQAREWMLWDFDRLASSIYRSRSIKLGFMKAHEAVSDVYAANGQIALNVLEDHLANRQWIVGHAPTIADIDIYGVVAYAPEAGFSMDAYPHITAWMKRFQGLEGFGTPEQVLPKETKAA